MKNAALPLIAVAMLAGCQANGGRNDASTGAPAASEDFPNDGTTPGLVEVDGVDAVTDEQGFVCLSSATGAVITTGVNGLVGAALDPLINALGGGSVTTLLNSVTDAPLAVDGDFATHATVTQTAGGLVGGLNALDVNLNWNSPSETAGNNFAVFALSVPDALLDLSLGATVQVDTLLEGEVQEAGSAVDVSGVSLLNTGLALQDVFWVGLQTTLPYDQLRLRLSTDLLALNVGEDLRIHEVCTSGAFVQTQ